MNRRDLLRSVGAGVALVAMGAGTLASSPQATEAAGRPNIVLCMADDQGWGDAGYNDHPVLQTPNLDDMAASGLQFDRFYAAAPTCSPTRASVLTGRHPNRCGCIRPNAPLPASETTIAKMLQGAGYATGHFGKWHLGSFAADASTSPGAHGFDEWVSAEKSFEYNPTFSHKGVETLAHGEGSMTVVNAALRFMRNQTHAAKPFLAVVWFSSPHGPLQASVDDRSPYSGETQEMQAYYGELTAMDRAIGRLRSELEDLGIRRNTLLWYCSDNGSNIGRNGGRGGKGALLEGGVRVPAILEWPEKIGEHRVSNVPCVTSDIAPTLLEVAGLAAPRLMDGISLVPLIDGDMGQRSAPIGFWNYPGDLFTPSAASIDSTAREWAVLYPGWATWLDWPWKLHRREDVKTGQVSVSLYNLAEDGYESKDVSAENHALVTSLSAALELWQKSVLQSMRA